MITIMMLQQFSQETMNENLKNDKSTETTKIESDIQPSDKPVVFQSEKEFNSFIDSRLNKAQRIYGDRLKRQFEKEKQELIKQLPTQEDEENYRLEAERVRIIEEAEAKEAELSLRELTLDAKDMLDAHNMPQMFMETLVLTDIENVERQITILKTVLLKGIEEGVNQRMVHSVNLPKSGSYASNQKSMGEQIASKLNATAHRKTFWDD